MDKFAGRTTVNLHMSGIFYRSNNSNLHMWGVFYRSNDSKLHMSGIFVLFKLMSSVLALLGIVTYKL